MATQIPLMRLTPEEVSASAYNLALLLQQKEEEEEAFKEAKTAHKETILGLNQGIKLERQRLLESRQAAHDAWRPSDAEA